MKNVLNLIDDDREAGVFRVNRRLMTSEEIFDLETERVFSTCWLYVGHDSELPRPGSFLRRTVGGRPLLLVRGTDNAVRAFFNTCPHRGATICREDAGTSRAFRCFYHAWTFDTSGRLVAVPDEAGYGPNFDRGTHGLTTPAQVDDYRGLYFVCYDYRTQPLADYLGAATEYLDLILDQAPTSMQVIRGTHKYGTKANWKLLVENSLDGYHGSSLHETYFDFVRGTGGGRNTAALGRGFVLDLGNGHTVKEAPAGWARPIAYWEPVYGVDAKPEIEQVRADLVARHGEERAARMADHFRNLLIFPNLVINDVGSLTFRQIEPKAADYFETVAFAVGPQDESPAQRGRRLDSFLTFLGPAGFASPDDVEALESCQRGFAAREVEWSDVSRGMSRTPGSHDELQMRTFWRAYIALLAGEPIPEPVREIESKGTL